jgi:hypothetical protein
MLSYVGAIRGPSPFSACEAIEPKWKVLVDLPLSDLVHA